MEIMPVTDDPVRKFLKGENRAWESLVHCSQWGRRGSPAVAPSPDPGATRHSSVAGGVSRKSLSPRGREPAMETARTGTGLWKLTSGPVHVHLVWFKIELVGWSQWPRWPVGVSTQ